MGIKYKDWVCFSMHLSASELMSNFNGKKKTTTGLRPKLWVQQGKKDRCKINSSEVEVVCVAKLGLFELWEMMREKSPGLKILWLWTIGTAGVLVASVVTTRMRDMEKLMNSQEQQQQPTTTNESTIIRDDTEES